MADATKSLESLFNDVRSQLSQSIGKQYDEKLLKGGGMLMVGDRWVAVPGPLKNQLKLYPFLLPDQYVYPDITEEEEEEKIRNKPR
uniref:Uncharacterized protein n=1 Tax=Brassica campestris TaxID=3711 RepID=A0A3P6AY54_BRACM|nr:unnamed protein product [Brassica rapa]